MGNDVGTFVWPGTVGARVVGDALGTNDGIELGEYVTPATVGAAVVG